MATSALSKWLRGRPARSASVAVTLAIFSLPGTARADEPAAKLISAPLVTPSDAWTYYGAGTIHTNGVAALAVTPPEIKALARTLGADRIGSNPGQMTAAEYTQNVYDYVRNNIAVEFRFGLGKGARGALIDQSGTPFDQAELMKKLLAEGGVAASYTLGTVALTSQEFGAWSGFIKGLNQTSQTFQIDAKAACQFLADGGIPATVNGATNCTSLTGDLTTLTMGHIWLQVGAAVYDPSFKRHTLKAGMDLPAAMGCGTEAAPTCGATATTVTVSGATQSSMSGSPTITNLNETALSSQLQTYATNLQTAVEASNADAPVEDIVGGKKVDTTFQPGSAVLPYAGGGVVQATWSGDVPNQFRTTFRFQFHTIDQLFYADELAGRRLTTDVGVDFQSATMVLQLDRTSLTSANFYNVPAQIVTTAYHPYAAISGAYADETTSWANFGGISAVVFSLGEAGPSRARHYADLESAAPEDISLQHPGKAVSAAQFVVQESQAAKLVGGVTRTSITQHHIVGLVGDLTNLATYASISSRTGSSAQRDAAFRSLAAVGGLLEGSVPQQGNDAWTATSLPALFSSSNGGSATFIDIEPANFNAVSSSLAYAPSYYQPQVTAGQNLIATLAQAQSTITGVNGDLVRPTGGFLAYSASAEGYWAGQVKGGAAPPNALDPTKTVLDSVKQTPSSLRAAMSADLASGSVGFSPTPDITTGAGAFPYALPFQRAYSSANSFDELEAAGAEYGVMRERYSGPDASSLGRLGGGWTHNFQITARINNDGLVGLGGERAIDATEAIVGLVVMANQNTAPTFQSRLSTILTANWVGQRFIGNSVAVSLSPSTVTFVRRANGSFGAPAGSADRLVQTGVRVGPVIVARDGTLPSQVTGVAYDYAGIGFAFTRSGGDTVSFTPSRWKDTPSVSNWGDVYEPAFAASQWQFPDGMRLTFAYAAVTMHPWSSTPDPGAPVRRGKQLTLVSNSVGRSLAFTVSDFKITRVTDETGRYASYTLTCGANSWYSCDAFSMTAPDAGVTRYEYTPDAASPNPPAFMPTPPSYTKPAYRLRRWFTPSNAATPFLTFAYDDIFRLKTVTDPLSRQTRYYAGAVVGGEIWKRGEIVDPANAEAVSIFDEDNRVVRSIDPLARVTTYAYDDAGRLTLKTYPEGNAEARAYDVRSNLLSVTLKAKPGSGLADIVSTTAYVEGPTVRACVNLITCNKPASEDGPRSDVTDVTNYSWNAITGNLTQVLKPADSAGVRPQIDLAYTSYAVGGSTIALPTSKTEKIDATTSVVTSYAYNASNKYVLQSAATDPTGLNLVTGFAFDAVGNVIAVDGPRTDVTDVTAYVWDANRRVRFQILPDPDGTGTLLRPTTRYTYNLDGQVTQVDMGSGASATGSDLAVLQTMTTVYDPVGNKLRVNTQAGVTQFAYDGANRTTCTAVRMNPAVYASLPADACTLGVQGANGPDRIARITYDLAGQALTTVQGLGTPDQRTYATYTYSLNGQQVTVADARNNLSTMEFDGFDRLIKLRFPSTTVGAGASSTTDYEAYTWDAAGSRTSVRKRDGQVIAYGYDALGRETLKDIPGGTAADVYTSYDAAGRITAMRFASAGGSGILLGYDTSGRMTSESTFGKTMTYAYDLASNRTRVTWPDAFYAEYTYDALGRMKTVGENGATSGIGLLATFNYDDLGRRTSLTRGNGTSTTYGYDSADRPTALTQDVVGTSYDQTFGFSWSPASQLLTRASSNPLYKWATPTPGTTANAYDGLNRDSAIVTAGGYDARGNLTADGSRTLTYDVENRMLTAVNGATTVAFAYDPIGRLSTVTTPTATTFLYDSDRLSAEYNAAGTLLRRYVHGPGVDEPLVWYEGASTNYPQFLHQDRQGSVIAWSSVNGYVAADRIYKYGPWGEPGDNWGAGSRFRYTGQIAIPEARLYSYKARMYDPATGRFMQTDPIGYKDDLDLYAYVGGDPVNKSDPDGQVAETIWDVANIVIGAASFTGNARQGNWGAAAVDAAGVVVDVVATAVPFVPGGAGAAIKGFRGAERAAGAVRTQRAASREARRQAGIPTSQQPTSQTSGRAPGGTPVGRQQTYETPTPGGGTQRQSVQVSRDQRGIHADKPQIEAGPIKPSGQVDAGGRPRIQNEDKVRVDFDPRK